MESCAVTSYESFWRLAQETYRAEFLKERSGTHDAAGYHSALSFVLRAAVRETTGECLTIARQMRANITRETHVDFYYDGYVAGCDKAIAILEGRT